MPVKRWCCSSVPFLHTFGVGGAHDEPSLNLEPAAKHPLLVSAWPHQSTGGLPGCRCPGRGQCLGEGRGDVGVVSSTDCSHNVGTFT